MARRSKLDRTIEAVGMFKIQVRDLYSHAKHHRLTFDELLKRRMDTIMGTQEYNTLPRWAQCEIRGYDEAKNDEFYDNHLIGLWELDGRLYIKGDPALDREADGRWGDVRYAGKFYPDMKTHYQGGDK